MVDAAGRAMVQTSREWERAGSDGDPTVPAAVLGALFRLSPHGMAVLEPGATVLHSNLAFWTLLGQTVRGESTPARLLQQRSLPNSAAGESLTALVERVAESGRGHSVNLVVDSVLGQHAMQRTLRASGLVLPASSRDGGLRCAVLLVDVTEHRHSAAARKSAEDNFRTLTEHLPDAVIIHRNGRTEYANPRARVLFEDETMSLLDDPFVTRFSPADQAGVLEEWRRLGSRSAPDEIRPRDVSIVRSNGTVTPCAMDNFSLEYNGHRCIVTVLRDLTRERELRSKLIQSDRLASAGALASGLGHELNNPLFVLLESLNQLEQGVDRSSSDEQRDLIRQARDAAKRIGSFVKEVRYVADLSQGMKQVDLALLGQAAVRLLRHRIEERATLHREVPEPVYVKGDSSQLFQIITVLLENAIQAIAPGSRSNNSIVLKVRRSDEAAEVVVEDTGVGIPQGLEERVFIPFFTTRHDRGALGLGLSHARDLAERHEGRIEITRRDPLGTRATLRLEQATPASSPSTRDKPRPRRLLFVDEDTRVLNSMRRQFRTDFVDTAESIEKAAQLLDRSRYDVVFCDHLVGSVFGRELYQRLQSNGRSETFILVGGRDEDGLACLDKPFERQQLEELLARLSRRAGSSPLPEGHPTPHS
jgi:PAS domain S-box-containing protein